MLKLPQIVDRVPVRHVIQLSPELDEALRMYASAYAETYGAAKPVADLIPAMLASFIEGDRPFSKWKRTQSQPSRERIKSEL